MILVGLEYQTISRIETGIYFTSFENLQKISKALNIQIKDLFDFSEKEIEREQLIELIMNDINLFDKKDLINIKNIINMYKDVSK